MKETEENLENPLTNLIKGIRDTVEANVIYHNPNTPTHILEQATYRMSLCLQDNSGCINKSTSYRVKPNVDTTTYNSNNYIEEETLSFNPCEYCGCSAPYLFYAPHKECKYVRGDKVGEVKWGAMLEKEDWEAFKKDNNLKQFSK